MTLLNRTTIVGFLMPLLCASDWLEARRSAPANQMIAYNGNTVVDSVTFDSDGVPGFFSTSDRTVSGCITTRVVLRPDKLDYIAYRNLSFER